MHFNILTLAALLAALPLIFGRSVNKISLNLDLSPFDQDILFDPGRVKCPLWKSINFSCNGDKDDDGDGDDDGGDDDDGDYPIRPFHRTGWDCEIWQYGALKCDAAGATPKVVNAIPGCTLEETKKYCVDSGACSCLSLRP